MIYFACKPEDFKPYEITPVRWLDCATEYTVAMDYWQRRGHVLAKSTWIKAHEYGYQYAVVIAEAGPISMAAVWRFSNDCWEVAAVSTLPSYRRRGYGRCVVSFVTTYILQEGRLATCSTMDDNLAMIATARAVGFHTVPQERVWWRFPNLPDF